MLQRLADPFKVKSLYAAFPEASVSKHGGSMLHCAH